jgi:hypothetical protein
MHLERAAKNSTLVGSEKSENILREKKISWNKNARELTPGAVRKPPLQTPNML